MLDDLRSYLQMASGVTEATTAKAKEVVVGLLSSGMSLTSKAVPAPEMMGQVQELADDLVATSKNNRDLLTSMIRSEVDRAVGRMGFVREDELAALRRHVQRLEKQIADLQESGERFARLEDVVEVVEDVTVVVDEVVVDEADVIADAAADATDSAPDASDDAPAEVADLSPDGAPADVVGEAVEPPRKKKKIYLDDSAGA